jgi:hypothetical protein
MEEEEEEEVSIIRREDLPRYRRSHRRSSEGGVGLEVVCAGWSGGWSGR